MLFRGSANYIETFSPDGNYLVVEVERDSLDIYETETGTLLSSQSISTLLNGKGGAFHFTSDNHLLTVTKDSAFKTTNLASGLTTAHLKWPDIPFYGYYYDYTYNKVVLDQCAEFVSDGDASEIKISISDNPDLGPQPPTPGITTGRLIHEDTPCNKSMVSVWNVHAQDSFIPFPHPSPRYQDLEFANDGHRLVSTTIARTHDDSGERLQSCRLAGCQISIWDSFTGNNITIERDLGRSDFGSFIFNGDSTRIGHQYEPGRLVFIDTNDGNVLFDQQISTAPVRTLGFLDDGERFFVNTNDSTVQLWSIPEQSPIRTFSPQIPTDNDIILSPEDSWIYSVAADLSTLVLWNTRIDHPVTHLLTHDNELLDFAFFKDQTRIISITIDGTVSIWDATSGERINAFETNTNVVTIDDANNRLISTEANAINVWDAITGLGLHTFPKNPVTQEDQVNYAISPYGSYAVIESPENVLELWNTKSFQKITSISGHSLPISDIIFNEKEHRFTTQSEDKIILWNAETGDVITTILSIEIDEPFARSPGGNHIAFTNYGLIWIINKKGEILFSLDDNDDTYLTTLTFYTNTELLSTNDEGRILLWDLDKQTVKQEIQVNDEEITSLSVNPNTTLLAAGFENGGVLLWDLKKNQQLLYEEVHEELVEALAFNATGDTLYSASMDGLIAIWHTPDPAQIAEFTVPASSRITQIALNPNLRQVAMSTSDGTLLHFTLNTFPPLNQKGKPTEAFTKLYEGSKAILDAPGDSLIYMDFIPLNGYTFPKTDSTRQEAPSAPLRPPGADPIRWILENW